MSSYYEYDNCLWMKTAGKGGRIKLFCLGGKRRGDKHITDKQGLSGFKSLKAGRDTERINQLLTMPVDPLTRNIQKQIKDVTGLDTEKI